MSGEANEGGTGEARVVAVRADGSGAMFDRIARRYDMLNRILSLGQDQRWRRKTVDALNLPPGGRVLDLATGTGDLAIAIARRCSGTTIVGVDPSAEMLHVAERKVREAGLVERITLRSGVAEELPFDDQSFDGACIAFGIRNARDRARGLREMTRVVRTGGRVAVLELSEPEDGVLQPLVRWHIRAVVPRIGAWLSGWREYRYLQSSVAAFPRRAAFADMMREAGLTVLAVQPLTFGACSLFVGTPSRGEA